MRILNLTNKNRRLDVLPNLDKIYKTIFGGGKVKKLNTTEEALNVALEVYTLVLEVLPEVELDENGNPIDTSDMNSSGEMGGENGDETNSMSDEEFEDMMDGIGNGSGEISTSNSNHSASGTDTDGKPVELTERQTKQLMKAIEKQKDFNNGDTKKVGKLSKKDAGIVKTMEDAGVEKVTAGENITSGKYDYNIGDYLPGKGVGVIYVKKLTQSMIDDRIFPNVLRGSGYWNWSDEDGNEMISKGIALGTKLGRKLQVRGEARDLKWNRLDSGKIDKRLIAELGFGNERVFSTTFVDKYSDAFLHISVDASGSMGGDKWKDSMISTIAICKAIDMIPNVDVVVSFRSTHDGNYSSRTSSTSPLILIGYDSRVDKFSKVKKMFPHIYPGGTTPEGLCFEAILKDIVPTSTNRDSYFLNLSDGMPMFSNSEINYYHEDARVHTKKMVNEIRKMGVNVLSYFIGDDYDRSNNMEDFKSMYGSDAKFIDVTNMMNVSKTMNEKFLEK
jgi:hypothetical protein